MSLMLLMTAATLAAAPPAPAATETSDVGYQELASGRSQQALGKLEAAGAADSNDPAVLINLGAAYAATGQTARAIAAYRSAIASRERYDLQLADGTWMDSRLAARTALKRLMSANAQAAR